MDPAMFVGKIKYIVSNDNKLYNSTIILYQYITNIDRNRTQHMLKTQECIIRNHVSKLWYVLCISATLVMLSLIVRCIFTVLYFWWYMMFSAFIVAIVLDMIFKHYNEGQCKKKWHSSSYSSSVAIVVFLTTRIVITMSMAM